MSERVKRVLTAVVMLLLAGSSYAATSLDGTVVAKRSDTLSVEFQPRDGVAPRSGDRVTFHTVKFGIRISAGGGEVTRVEGSLADVRITEGNPPLQVNAVIEATGRPVEPPRPTQAVAQPAEPRVGRPATGPQDGTDHGWGGAANNGSPEQRVIEEVIAAKDVCDYQYAEQLAANGRKQMPGNVWLQENYPALRTLAQRDRNYRQAMQSARYAIDNEVAEDSFPHLKTAMENASTQCGQDQEVRSLHAQAKQMLDVKRERAVEQARQQNQARERREAEQRAADERERAQREADAREVEQGLLNALSIMSGGNRAQPSPSPAYQGDDWVEQARPKIEQNETWQKWRETQGW